MLRVKLEHEERCVPGAWFNECGLLSALCGEEGEGDADLRGMGVSAEALDHVLVFSKHRFESGFEKIEITAPVRSTDVRTLVKPEWYGNFVFSLGTVQLHAVTIAAKKLNAQSLYNVCCAGVAALLWHGAPKIEDMYGLPPLDEKERAALEEKHSWVFSTRPRTSLP